MRTCVYEHMYTYMCICDGFCKVGFLFLGVLKLRALVTSIWHLYRGLQSLQTPIYTLARASSARQQSNPQHPQYLITAIVIIVTIGILGISGAIVTSALKVRITIVIVITIIIMTVLIVIRNEKIILIVIMVNRDNNVSSLSNPNTLECEVLG